MRESPDLRSTPLGGQVNGDPQTHQDAKLLHDGNYARLASNVGCRFLPGRRRICKTLVLSYSPVVVGSCVTRRSSCSMETCT